jgi:inner membrane protein involved in colicin E2 resistance
VVNERVAGLLEAEKAARLDHEKRIRFLERTINYAVGFIGAVSTALYLISVLKK